MQDVNTLLKQLLEAGVHFGHQTNRWNPKMAKYIFGEKNGVYIVDLQKTVEGLNNATEFLKSVVARGDYVLFVGTKKQAQNIIKEHVKRCEMFYVVERWLGGTLTNFKTIRQSVKRLNELEKLKEDGTFELLSKKEKAQIGKEIDKLLRNLGGIRKMDRLPGALFIVDSKNEEIAIKEANRLSIPVVALVDTNSDPTKIDYVIPGNDDALRSIELITSIIAENILEGRQEFLKGAFLLQKEAAKAIDLEADEEEVEQLVDGKGIKKEKEEPARKKPKRKPAREQK